MKRWINYRWKLQTNRLVNYVKVDRLHLDVTDRQVSQYRQVDRLHSDVTYRQVKDRSNSNSRTWLIYPLQYCWLCLGNWSCRNYKVSSYVLCEQTKVLSCLFFQMLYYMNAKTFWSYFIKVKTILGTSF